MSIPSTNEQTSNPAYPYAPPTQGRPRRWSRPDAALGLQKWDEAKQRGLNERDAAREAGGARSTIRRWGARRDAHELPLREVQFLESPEGVAFLHRITTALEFVVGMLSPSGIRLICTFLQLSGLDAFVGASVGGVHRRMSDLEQRVVDFGEEQRANLARRMPQKQITVCEDETFHPKICLVAIDAASNFILLEEYAEDRTRETWDAALDRALKGLPVEVIQATSDEAKALVAHAANMDAHHSPDVFHVQREASRAMSLPLSRRVDQATDALKSAMTATEQALSDQAAYTATIDERGPGRPPDFDGRIQAARAEERQAETILTEAIADRDAARAAIAGVSTDYHPYSLSEGGAMQTQETVATKIGERLATLESIAQRAGLSTRAEKGLAKARRVIPAMANTIGFVHKQTATRIDALARSFDLSFDAEDAIVSSLVPAAYLTAVAGRAPNVAERTPILASVAKLAARLAPDSAFHQLPSTQQATINEATLRMAQLFQRSSSSVEGRNGYLALQHHGLHKLSSRKLRALTVTHNFFATRSDGTTAAARFFESQHDDLFDYLLAKLPQPPRPARRPKRSPSLAKRGSVPAAMGEN